MGKDSTQFSEPKITIDLAEYNELLSYRKEELENNQEEKSSEGIGLFVEEFLSKILEGVKQFRITGGPMNELVVKHQDKYLNGVYIHNGYHSRVQIREN